MSQGESKRYLTLKRREALGEIDRLELQPKFPIIIKGEKVCNVILDFSYRTVKTGAVTIEDYKGMDTPISRLKRKLVKAVYDIDVVVVKRA